MKNIEDKLTDSNKGKGKRKPHNLADTEIFQESKAGMHKVWSNYLNMLARSFQKMSRNNQEQLIVRVCQIVTVGTTVLIISLFYSFLPPQLRVIIVPIALIGAWWAGTKMVAPQMMVRFAQHLNREY